MAIGATKGSVGAAPEINLRIHYMQETKHASKMFTLTIKSGADVTRSPNRGNSGSKYFCKVYAAFSSVSFIIYFY